MGAATGPIELLATAAVVLLVFGAGVVGRGRVSGLIALAIVFGVVFVNPFGLVVRPSAVDPRPVTPTAAADTAAHWVKVAGVPVAWFKPYRSSYAYSGDNGPSADLKIRYGFSFLPSTGSTSVVGMCSTSVTDPCWKPGAYPLVHHDASGKTWLVPLTQTPFGNPISYLNAPHFYDVHVGVVSRGAFVYWLAIACLIGVAAARSPVDWRQVALASAGGAAAGVVVALALGVSSTARSATEVEPKLIPKATPIAPTSGSTAATVITDQSYAGDCVEKEQDRTTFHCTRAEQLTAVSTRAGILALWTARPTRTRGLELRARRLTRDGKPLGPSRAVLAPWSNTSPTKPGYGNCAWPSDLQAAPISGGRVLVAWSDRCLIYSAARPDPIHGLVVDATGRALGRPFDIVKVRATVDSGEAPEFALASTTDGRAFLSWVAKPAGSDVGASTFVSFLDGRERADGAGEVAQQGGQMTVACAATCAVGIPNGAGERIVFVDASGKLAATLSLPVDPAVIATSPAVLATRGHEFFAGWIESTDAVSATAKVARLGVGAVEQVATVWPRFSTGPTPSPSLPAPLGLGFVAGEPALAWQVFVPPGGRDAGSALYVASAHRRTDRRIAEYLTEGSMPEPADALVAVGLAHFGEPDPISIPAGRW